MTAPAPAFGAGASRPAPRPPRYELLRPVFIVGFMGAGKTTLGRRLARTCGCASIDLDKYIERAFDCRISSVFETQGEEAFRIMESQCLAHVADGDPAFVSCGGGIVERAQNRDVLRERGFTLYLKVDADEAASRIGRPASRPLLADMDEARARAELRRPLYEAVADATVNTAGLMARELSRLAVRQLRAAGVLVAAGGSSRRT